MKQRLLLILILSCVLDQSQAQLYTSEVKVESTPNGYTGIGTNDTQNHLTVAGGTIGLYGPGLDGSTYQRSVLYSDTLNGFYFDAPKDANSNRLPIQFGWRGESASLVMTGSGNIGVGTNAPLENLSIYGTDSNVGKKFSIGPVDSRKWVFWTPGYDVQSQYGEYPLVIQRIIGFHNNFTGDFVIQGAPGATDFKVDVNSNVFANKYYAKSTTVGSWPDFVFANNYPLLPLNQIEQYVQKHHHLPDIPSAQEVKQNGIELVEMNTKLLQKIEELTLYLIDQEKRLKAVEQTNRELQQTLQTLTAHD